MPNELVVTVAGCHGILLDSYNAKACILASPQEVVSEQLYINLHK